MRTAFFHQYNASVQYALGNDLLLEVAYVGTRGHSLIRNVRINQARLASQQQPIVNVVTGQVITTNTPANANAVNRRAVAAVQLAAGRDHHCDVRPAD